MKSRYPLVPLGHVLRIDLDEVTVEPDASYRFAGVYSFGRGLFARSPVAGTDTSYRSLNRLHVGGVVLSRLKAFEGAVAVVTDEFDGWFLSAEFPTFSCSSGKAEPCYINHLCRWRSFWELLATSSKGVGARRERVHPDRFLAIEVPIPDVEEQRRVARQLDASMSRWSDATAAAGAFMTTVEAVRAAWLGRAMKRFSTQTTKVGDAAVVYRGRGPDYQIGSGKMVVNQACVRPHGLDLRACREVDSMWWTSVPAELRTHLNDVLVNSTGEGTIGRSAVAVSDAVGLPFDSHVLAARVDVTRLLPHFLDAYLKSPAGQAAIESLKSANTTKQTELGKQKLEDLTVPMPSREDQVALICDLQRVDDRIARARRAGAERGALLAALPTTLLNRAFAGLM